MKTDYITRYSLHPGDYETLNSYEQRRYITFTFFSTIAIFVSFIRLVYVNFFSPVHYDSVVKFINTIPFALSILLSLIVNARNYKKVLIIMYFIIPVVLSVTHYYTGDEGVENFILLFIILAFFFFDKPVELLVAFFYNSIHYLIISHRDYFYLSGKVLLPPYDATLAIYNNVTSMLLIFLSFYISKMQLWKYEKTVTNRTIELENLNTFKDKIFSTIAHDLKSPMAANLTLLKGLENNKYLSNDQYKENIGDIRRSVENTNELVFDMLTWAKNELQKTEPVMEKLSLKDIVCEIKRELNYKAEEKNIQLTCSTDENATIVGDKNTVKIILRNLVSNAIKFTASGGNVNITSHHSLKKYSIIVEDNGIGIHPEKINSLFNGSLYTTKGTNNETGTGLGLVICNSLAKKFNGSLEIDSEINNGTRVKLSLPVLQ
ncbi:MAG: HAMP domain-containing sensor histidine kinase [Lacibacter sp.]